MDPEPLFRACCEGSVEDVQNCLKILNIDPNSQDGKGDTALILASRRGFEDKIRVLLDAGAMVNVRNKKGSSALIAAAMNGHLKLCQILLEHGANVNDETESQDTAISLCVWQNHTEVCLLLMRHGADISHVDKFGDTLLLDSARHGNVPVMRELLERKVDINHANKKGETSLIRAVLKGDAGAVQLLLDHNADLTPKVIPDGWDALMIAAKSHHVQIVKLLLDKGASVTSTDASGRSCINLLMESKPRYGTPNWDIMERVVRMACPLDYPANFGNTLMCIAASHSALGLVDALVARGCDVSFGDPENHHRTALMAALMSKNPNITVVKLLLAKGSDIDDQDDMGLSPLMMAVVSEKPEIVELLLERGASMVLLNKKGETALDLCLAKPNHNCLAILSSKAPKMSPEIRLLHAAQAGNVKDVLAILDEGKGVDVDAADSTGRTALMLSARAGHEETCKVLLSRGADVTLRDKEGLSALMWALQSNKKVCASLLARAVEDKASSGGASGAVHGVEYAATTQFLIRLALGLSETLKIAQKNKELQAKIEELSK